MTLQAACSTAGWWRTRHSQLECQSKQPVWSARHAPLNDTSKNTLNFFRLLWFQYLPNDPKLTWFSPVTEDCPKEVIHLCWSKPIAQEQTNSWKRTHSSSSTHPSVQEKLISWDVTFSVLSPRVKDSGYNSLQHCHRKRKHVKLNAWCAMHQWVQCKIVHHTQTGLKCGWVAI